MNSKQRDEIIGHISNIAGGDLDNAVSIRKGILPFSEDFVVNLKDSERIYFSIVPERLPTVKGNNEYTWCEQLKYRQYIWFLDIQKSKDVKEDVFEAHFESIMGIYNRYAAFTYLEFPYFQEVINPDFGLDMTENIRKKTGRLYEPVLDFSTKNPEGTNLHLDLREES